MRQVLGVLSATKAYLTSFAFKLTILHLWGLLIGGAMDEKILFEKRVKRYKGLIKRIIMRHAANPSIRDDLMQQTFLRAWIHRNSFQRRSKYSTWLCRIAINTTLNYLISQKSKVKVIDKYEIDVENVAHIQHYLYISPDKILSDQENLDIVADAIRTLPGKIGAPLILNVIYGYDYERVASMLSLPIGTVRSCIYRARNILRAKFLHLL